jgi:hypothetical protein
LTIRAFGIAASAVFLIGCTPLVFAGAAHATDNITWFTPSNPSNSNANWPGGSNYTNNFGIAFQTGSGSPNFTIDWLNLGLNTSTSTSGSGTITVALRNTTNSTAYSAAAGTTEYARDVVPFTAPTSTSTNFQLTLDSTLLPNITGYAMGPSTAYSLIAYAPTGGSWGMRRTTGFANDTTNNYYTTTNGFVPLNTFRNNAEYSNSLTSYPTLEISFGARSTPLPQVPGPLPLLGVGAAFGWSRQLRKRIHASIRKEQPLVNEAGEAFRPPLRD